MSLQRSAYAFTKLAKGGPLRGSLRTLRSGSAPLREVRASQHQHPQHRREAGFFTPTGPTARSGKEGEEGEEPRQPERPSFDPQRRVSDREYMLRVGRAYDLLRGTMPEFMRTGLVDYDSASTSSSHGMSLLEAFTFRRLLSNDRSNEERHSKEKLGEEEDLGLDRFNRAYHPAIHFRFCAHVPSSHSSSTMSSSSPSLSPSNGGAQGDEDASLSFSGRSLYFASASVLRHTLNALFSEARVDVERIRLERRDGSLCSQGGGTMTGARNHVLHLRATFTGKLRMTRAPHRYTLVFKYDFDDDTGLICRHTVMRIEPEIGKKLWAGLSTVWQRLAGLAPQEPHPQTAHAHCNGRVRYVLESASPHRGEVHARLVLLPRAAPRGPISRQSHLES
ncbi:hypothetical protein FA10DRAFT_287361 [Acaromyces ingoldii]|uniref:Uncharacterized protein n=1 Tax=Acaromyces ingoldii TaxID=215250 RepID=A0A316YK94_9BASI|nr:hypothetical protein FA10DRAFT_287361 [Acaromyces ingoldii]PWN89496.1 hypothetical protein FA10DRAFT_287361 [Acaromyces ingoldii]